MRRPHARLVLALLASLSAAGVARADDLDEVRRLGQLRWGADQEGGGPYVFPRDDDPRQVQGFEVELAQALAKKIGVEAVFVQGQWDKLPDLLRIRKIHIVLNGYELTPAHRASMEPTAPYYAYSLQLLGRKGGAVAGWDDLQKPGLRVGALTGSAGEAYLQRFCQKTCRVVSYDGVTDSMREVETRKLDATLQDTPASVFYAPRFPGLVALGEPVAPGLYVAYARKGERRLVEALDQALAAVRSEGELERIYRRYGLWSDAQARLGAASGAGAAAASASGAASALGAAAASGSAAASVAASAAGAGAAAASGAASAAEGRGAAPDNGGSGKEPTQWVGERKRGLSEVGRAYGGVLLEAAGLTVALSVLAFPLAALMGLGLAVGRMYGPRWLGAALGVWVEFLRGTPLMLQLYFAFFVLPEVGVALPAFATGVLGLAVNYSAYEAEIYRAGLQAVPAGQMEAALALGLSRGQALRSVVIPQAVRTVIPPMVNDFIALFKDTSVCSVITLVELTKRFSVLSQSTQATVELMALTAALYLAMSYPLSVLSRRLERRLAQGQRA